MINFPNWCPNSKAYFTQKNQLWSISTAVKELTVQATFMLPTTWPLGTKLLRKLMYLICKFWGIWEIACIIILIMAWNGIVLLWEGIRKNVWCGCKTDFMGFYFLLYEHHITIQFSLLLYEHPDSIHFSHSNLYTLFENINSV